MEEEQEQKVIPGLAGPKAEPELEATATVALAVAEEGESFDFGWFD